MAHIQVEKILIFKSIASDTIYSWNYGNDNKIVVIRESAHRALGAIFNGSISLIDLVTAYDMTYVGDEFSVGDAAYIVLAKI